MSKKPKTQGLEWLIFSLMAFNGSGYADMTDAESFLDSYIAYKTVGKKQKNKPDAVFLATQYKDVVLVTITELLSKTLGAGREPNKAVLYKMQQAQKQLL